MPITLEEAEQLIDTLNVKVELLDIKVDLLAADAIGEKSRLDEVASRSQIKVPTDRNDRG